MQDNKVHMKPPKQQAKKPNMQMPVQQQKKSNTGKTIVIVLVALVVAIGIIVALCLAFCSKDNFYDANSIIGQAPYKTEEEIQEELNRKVEEGMFNISIASVIEFEDGAAPGTAYIENVPGNPYVMQVDITLDDTGEKVYESGGLKPDSYIKDIALSKDLDAGTYQATATFHAIDQDTLEEVGQAAAKVTLNVLN
ncbi:hypothetical protein [Adlercreutzia sp. ZJ304]|uniref:hypothetical protein n=1 Tax=Adlercreutzia sp. ZJ304 TaxID=2709791 RepID=UPI0013EDBABD|nr:hypothetical protein [Adlercreutzia sp. ZJ304]